nr:reverse transcriptase domain-containing protein [Tanacetum cinerariifolium]
MITEGLKPETRGQPAQLGSLGEKAEGDTSHRTSTPITPMSSNDWDSEEKELGHILMRELRSIPSTTHAMIKFPTPRGIAKLVPRTTTIFKCRQLEEKQITLEEQSKEEMTGRYENSVEEEVMVNFAFPDQKVIMGTQFSPTCQKQLINLLGDNQDMFAWQPSDMAGVPRRIIQHSLNVNVSITLVAQKQRILSSEKSKAAMKEVKEWIRADTNVEGRRRENNLLHRSGDLLLHQDAIRPEEHMSNVPKAGRFGFPSTIGKKLKGICG